MEAFHELKVNCPYEILEVEDMRISNKPNEHGSLYLKVLVDEDVNFKYAIEASTDDKICIYEETENQEKTIIFNGTIQNIRTSNVNRLYHMEIEALTSSFIFDIQEKSRSFQDAEMSYDDLINTILRDYKIYSFTQCMDKPMSIGRPLFQYKETDYEFLKRVASHLGLELICDIINTNNVFYFGRPTGKSYEIEDDIDYSAFLDVKKYRECLGYSDDFHPTDFFYYEIKSKKVMEIGAKVTFKAKELYINSYEAEYVRGDLIFTYKLCRQKGIWQEKLYNEKIKGISLEGKVMEVSGEQVKLHLNIDEAQSQSKAAWFRYAPPTGNLMYSMPIVGTNANLYFSSERTEDPMVIGCVRKNGSSCENFSNVNNRYFATESGNNLDLLPGAINFSRPGLSANFNDGSGITLSSSSSLSINAGYVGMFAGNVSITGTTKLVAEKGGSFLSLENEFYNDAGIVMENGSDRASNGPFDDDPQNGVAEAIASSMAAAMQAAIGNVAAAVQGAIGKIGDCLAGGAENQKGNVESEASSSKLDKNSFIDSAINFLTGAQRCEAAERENTSNNKESGFSNGNKDVGNLNDPLNLYSNKPWMNVDTNIKLPQNESYITHDDGNSIPVDSDPYRVHVGESGDGFWGKVADCWVSTPIYKGLSNMAEWQDKHPQEMELLNIGMIFVGLTAYGTSSSMFLDDECKIVEKDAVKVTNKNLSISDEELEEIINMTKGNTDTAYSSLRDLMSPEEVERYDEHWYKVAEDISNEGLDKQINFIKNGGITKPGGGKYKPAKISATVDMNTGDIYYGYNGANKFNPSKTAIVPELQQRIDYTKDLARNTQGNQFADRDSFEIWSVDNCAEVYSVNNALTDGAEFDNIFINTKFFKDGTYAAPCKNCQITFEGVRMPEK